MLADDVLNPWGFVPPGCFARDIITTIVDEAEFLSKTPILNEESIDTACALYLGSEEPDALDSDALAA